MQALPVFLLIDDHIHFTGSVLCNRPMWHKQADSCKNAQKTWVETRAAGVVGSPQGNGVIPL